MTVDQQTKWPLTTSEVFSTLDDLASQPPSNTNGALEQGCTEPRVRNLASYALGKVASTRNEGAAGLSEPALDALISAACAPAGGGCVPIADDLIRKGISKNELMDLYIPTIARRLGERWEEDELSFMEVTMGTARIQRLVRYLNDKNTPHPFLAGSRPKILLAVPQDESHTLGALVATAQLRRMGALVRLLIGQESNSLVNGIQNDCFDAVFVSAGQSGGASELKILFDKIRSACDRPPPIVLGGAITSALKGSVSDIGADLITSNPGEALEKLGLTPTALSDAQTKRTAEYATITT